MHLAVIEMTVNSCRPRILKSEEKPSDDAWTKLGHDPTEPNRADRLGDKTKKLNLTYGLTTNPRTVQFKL